MFLELLMERIVVRFRLLYSIIRIPGSTQHPFMQSLSSNHGEIDDPKQGDNVLMEGGNTSIASSPFMPSCYSVLISDLQLKRP
jgi:hypothetical protein